MLKSKTYRKYLITAGLCIFPLVLYLVPTDWLNSHGSVCLFRNLTGHECYGCGMTRALFAFIHLRFEEAFRFNKLVVVVFPLLVYIWGNKIFSLWRINSSPLREGK